MGSRCKNWSSQINSYLGLFTCKNSKAKPGINVSSQGVWARTWAICQLVRLDVLPYKHTKKMPALSWGESSQLLLSTDSFTSMIFMTEATPIRWRATIESPTLTRLFLKAWAIATSRMSSVDSESVALADPSARSGIKPLQEQGDIFQQIT